MTTFRFDQLPDKIKRQITEQDRAEAARKRPTFKRHKYNATATHVDGIRFPSKAEAARYETLKLLKAVGEIRWFCRQAIFDLPGGIKYLADFVIVLGDGTVRVEDVKGFKTPEYLLKRKQVQALYGVTIAEVR